MNSVGEHHQVDSSESTFDGYPDELPEKDRSCYMEGFIRGVLHNVNGYLQNLYMLSEILMDGQERQDRYTQVRCADSRREWDKLSADQRRRLENLRKQTTGLADRVKDLLLLSETGSRETDVQLNHILSRLVDVFQGDLFLRHRVKLKFQLEDGLPMVRILGSDFITAMVHMARYALARADDAPEKVLTVRSHYEEGFIRVDLRVAGNGNARDCPPALKLTDPMEVTWPNGPAASAPAESSPDLDLLAVHRLLSSYGVRVRTEGSPEGTLAILEVPAAARSRHVV